MPARPGSITSANANFTITIPGIFTAPVALKGYSAEDIFSIDQLEPLEESMGLDGILSAGWVYQPIKQTIKLQANSPSIATFDTWFLAQQTLIDIYQAAGLITLPSLGKKWTMLNGYLKGYTPIPDAAKTLKPQTFQIVWNQMIPLQI